MNDCNFVKRKKGALDRYFDSSDENDIDNNENDKFTLSTNDINNNNLSNSIEISVIEDDDVFVEITNKSSDTKLIVGDNGLSQINRRISSPSSLSSSFLCGNIIVDLTKDDNMNEIQSFNDTNECSELDDPLDSRPSYIRDERYSIKIDEYKTHQQCFYIPSICNCLMQHWIYANVYYDNEQMASINSGKWMLLGIREDSIDNIWQKVLQLSSHGLLGISTKVSVNIDTNNQDEYMNKYVIIIYTYDYEDIKDIMRVLLSIRDNIVEYSYCLLNYKTDVATSDGIYSNDKLAMNAGFQNTNNKNSGELVSMYQSPKIDIEDKSIKLIRNNVGPDNKRYEVGIRLPNNEIIIHSIDKKIEYLTKTQKKKRKII